MKKNALIFGITGQDGYFLTKLLIGKKYKIYDFARNKYKTIKVKNLI